MPVRTACRRMVSDNAFFLKYSTRSCIACSAASSESTAVPAEQKPTAQAAKAAAPAKKTSQPKELTMEEIERIKARAERFGATVCFR